MFKVNGIDQVNAKVEVLTQNINNLTVTNPSIVAVVAQIAKFVEAKDI